MRLRWWMLPIAVVVLLMWRRTETRPLDLVAGTTHDTFAVLDRATGRLTEVGSDNKPVRELTVPITKDTRVVGTNRGAAIVWHEGRRIALAVADDLDRKQLHGKRVEKLCSQAATTHLMFGIGWLERDGAIWVLRGSSYDVNAERATLAVEELDDAEVASPYCGVTDADHAIALLYRNGNRFEMVRCEEGHCSKPRRVALPKHDTILGFGCTRRYCLIATRDKSGAASLFWVDDKGGKVDSLSLAGAKDSPVNVAGEGDRFAISYLKNGAPVVEHSQTPGHLARIWEGGEAVPVLSWMGNVLLIGGQAGGKLVTVTRAL